MKNYTITVNGNVYDVTVEEGGAGAAAAPKAAAPKAHLCLRQTKDYHNGHAYQKSLFTPLCRLDQPTNPRQKQQMSGIGKVEKIFSRPFPFIAAVSSNQEKTQRRRPIKT